MLKLKDYFFPVIHVASDAKYGAKNNNDVIWDNKVTITENKEEDIYQVAVEMFAGAENEDNRIPYSVQLVVIGFFAVHPKAKDPEKLLYVNGSSLLYSAAREFLITVTSRMPWGQIMLPTYNFLADYNELHNDNTAIEATAKSPDKENPASPPTTP